MVWAGRYPPSSKVAKRNGLDLKADELPGWFPCHIIAMSSFPCKELKHEASVNQPGSECYFPAAWNQ